jgi:exonuclease III
MPAHSIYKAPMRIVASLLLLLLLGPIESIQADSDPEQQSIGLCENLLISSGSALRRLISQLRRAPTQTTHLSPDQSTDVASMSINQSRGELMVGRGTNVSGIRLATYNLNRVNMRLLRNRIYAESRPLLERVLRNYLQGTDAPDVFSIQELWHPEDHSLIAEIASELGYSLVLVNPALESETGLQILVRRHLQIESARFEPFVHSGRNATTLWERAASVSRGALIARLRLPDDRRITIINTHFTPLSSNFWARERQATAMQEILEREGALSIILADLNIAADFNGGTEDEIEALRRIRFQYEGLFQRWSTIDAFRAVHEAEIPGYTNIIEFPRPSSLRVPAANKRIDYILLRENGTLAFVADARRRFFEPRNQLGAIDRSCNLYPSDHCLLEAEILLFEVNKP